jgi:hypothetical protein
MKRTTPLVIALAAGATLSIACSGKKDPDPDVPNKNPPAVDEPAVDEPAVDEPIPEPSPSGRPSWDDIGSPHPKGASNPPSPVLIVTPNGTCHKNWEGGMIPAGPDRVQECDGDALCGTIVVCPERAADLLDAYKATEDAAEPE